MCRRQRRNRTFFSNGRVGGLRDGARALVGCSLGLVVAVTTIRVLLPVAGAGAASPAATAAPRADEVLLTLLGWVGVALAGWLAVGSALGMLSLLPGAAGQIAADAADRVTPMVVRKALTLVLGASVGSVALPSAPISLAGSLPIVDRTPGSGGQRSGADDADTHPASPRRMDASRVPTALLSPGFEPTEDRVAPDPAATPAFRPTTPTPAVAEDRSRLLAPDPRASVATHDLVTVRRGDTLWSIARRHLGHDATDAQVAREWPRWHAANRALIGDDPDRILPGRQLRPPGRATNPVPSPLAGPRPSFAPTDAGAGATPARRGAPR